MLKIKNNVDLKELEKFGFEYNEYMYEPFIGTPSYEKRFLTNDRYKDTLINICVYDYKIQMFDCNDDDYQYIWNEEYVQDLIKADLVEKVSDGNERIKN